MQTDNGFDVGHFESVRHKYLRSAGHTEKVLDEPQSPQSGLFWGAPRWPVLARPLTQPSDYGSHEEQQAAIESYLTWRNRRRDLSITTWNEYKREIRLPA